MNLNPWKLWSHAGKPLETTTEIMELLEKAIKENPPHPGTLPFPSLPSPSLSPLVSLLSPPSSP
jgi:hypothetical protein